MDGGRGGDETEGLGNYIQVKTGAWTPLYLTHTLSVTNYMSDKLRLSL